MSVSLGYEQSNVAEEWFGAFGLNDGNEPNDLPGSGPKIYSGGSFHRFVRGATSTLTRSTAGTTSPSASPRPQVLEKNTYACNLA
jgi:hypothetical protein